MAQPLHKLHKENLILGELDVSKLYLGNTKVSAVYMDNYKIWPLSVIDPTGPASISLIVGWLDTTTAGLRITVSGGSKGITIPGAEVYVEINLKNNHSVSPFPVWNCRVSAFNVPAGEIITQTYRGSFRSRQPNVIYTYKTSYDGMEYSGDMLDMFDLGELGEVLTPVQ